MSKAPNPLAEIWLEWLYGGDARPEPQPTCQTLTRARYQRIRVPELS